MSRARPSDRALALRGRIVVEPAFATEAEIERYIADKSEELRRGQLALAKAQAVLATIRRQQPGTN